MAENSKIKLSTKIRRNPDVAWRILGGYLIAITPSDNRVHRFNETGTFIWKCLEGAPLSLAEVKQKIEGHFDMQDWNAEGDLLSFIPDIVSKGVIQIEP